MSGLSRRDGALALAVLVAVAVLVGIATRPAPGASPASVPAEPLVLLLQTAVWLVVAADILITVAIVYVLATDKRWLRQQLAKRHWSVTLASYLAALMPTALATLMILFLRQTNGSRGALPVLLGAGFGRPRLGSSLAGAAAAGSTTWASLLLAVLLVVLFLGWLFWPAPRRKPVERVTPPVPDSVSQMVDDSLEALQAISDPRRAIITAYSSMERSMTRVGLPRRVSEAPLEFVVRALRSFVGVSNDLNRLTFLFELAKFSDHAIDEEMRSSAIAALSAIRAQLITAPSPSA